MGAGAGVTFECNEFAGYEKSGRDLIIRLGECTFGSYYWSMRCNRPGYVLVKDFLSQLKDLEWVERIHGYPEGWPEDLKGIVKTIDWKGAEISDGYESRLEFVIGGGYVITHVKKGFTETLDSQNYYSLNVHVYVPAVTKDGRKIGLSGYWYPWPMEFHASDLFSEMYEWCWENEDGDFVTEMYEHEGFATEYDRQKFVEQNFADGWEFQESDFNGDSYYDDNGFVASQCRKRKWGRKRTKQDSWIVKRSSERSSVRCPSCGSTDCEKETSFVRHRGQYPDARKSVHMHCRKCDFHWSSEATMKESATVRLLGKRKR